MVAEDDPDRGTPGARRPDADLAQPALRHEEGHRVGRRRRGLLRGPPALGDEDHVRVRPARRTGRSGSSATSPRVLAGVLDIDSSEKAARFVRTCDAFNVPLVDLRRRARASCRAPTRSTAGSSVTARSCSTRICEATVPRIQVITRKAYGGRVRRHELQVHRRGPRLRVADGRARGHGSQGAVEIVYRRELAAAADPAARRAELVDEYTERYANPYLAAERGYVDDVIDPADTRRVLVSSLELLRTKREDLPKRKHGNVPL